MPRGKGIRPRGYKIQREGIPPTWVGGKDMRKLFYHRVSSRCGSDFVLTEESFTKFLEVMGPIPDGMVKPTVGRLDHSKGYVYDHERKRWNFEWQSKSDNSREDAVRRWHGETE